MGGPWRLLHLHRARHVPWRGRRALGGGACDVMRVRCHRDFNSERAIAMCEIGRYFGWTPPQAMLVRRRKELTMNMHAEREQLTAHGCTVSCLWHPAIQDGGREAHEYLPRRRECHIGRSPGQAAAAFGAGASGRSRSAETSRDAATRGRASRARASAGPADFSTDFRGSSKSVKSEKV